MTILKPYTIIPKHLYVHRDADRQVKNIVEDMGRPGYVLVSRQMGKTNLILNAKRELETADDLFVYVDMSNAFGDSRSCFQNIIDTALESDLSRFEGVRQIIDNNRKNQYNIPPHKQHNQELKIILKNISNGKLVIILDEIDALTKTSYSDEIFSQIRSSYFSARINNSEFYNLTYLLSGVVEPNDIIKDPKISPFNIGEKIYLNDFSRMEFNSFLQKSNLNISEDIANRIFFWTSGNPRITWDVCAEVERTGATELTIDWIDRLVKSMYLTTFDKPPLDNIRELVTNDRELRNAVAEIQYGKAEVISDKIKAKLYLSGIINYTNGKIHIKNEVINRGLNLDWIKSLELEEKNILSTALELYENGKYQEALNIFEQYLENDEFPETEKDHCYYLMGYAKYLEGSYTKALDYFNNVNFDLEYNPRPHFNLENLKGMVFEKMGRYDESEKLYNYVIAKSRRDEVYLRGLINLAQLQMALPNQNIEKAKGLFLDVINNNCNLTDKVRESIVNIFKSLAYYNLAKIELQLENYTVANEYIERGLPIASPNTKTHLLLLQSQLSSKGNEKKNLLQEILEFFTDNELLAYRDDPELHDIDTIDIFRVLVDLYEADRDSCLQFLKDRKTILADYAYEEKLYSMGGFAIRNNKFDIGIDIYLLIYSLYEKKEFEKEAAIYGALKVLSYYQGKNLGTKIPLGYIDIFEKYNMPLDKYDFEIFANTIDFLVEQNDIQQALRVANIIYSRKDISNNHAKNYILIDFFVIKIYNIANDKINSLNKAKEMLNNIEKFKKEHGENDVLEDADIAIIKKNALALIAESKIKEPIKNRKLYGRNDLVKVKYKSGLILTIKYKKVEHDVNTGECVIL